MEIKDPAHHFNHYRCRFCGDWHVGKEWTQMKTATKKIIVRPTEAELVWLMNRTVKDGFALDLAFGPSGAWLEEDPADPSAAYRALMLKRGVANRNTDGAGI